MTHPDVQSWAASGTNGVILNVSHALHAASGNCKRTRACRMTLGTRMHRAPCAGAAALSEMLLSAYRTILRLHRAKLPPAVRAIGDADVRAEFRAWNGSQVEP